MLSVLSVLSVLSMLHVHGLLLHLLTRFVRTPSSICTQKFGLACSTECEYARDLYVAYVWIKRTAKIKMLTVYMSAMISQGNFEFGISRIIKSLEPYEKKLGTDTWFYAKRCFLALAEQVG